MQQKKVTAKINANIRKRLHNQIDFSTATIGS